ncbi:MAG: DUF3857 domain-containing protein [Burkholderiales bacterium]
MRALVEALRQRRARGALTVFAALVLTAVAPVQAQPAAAQRKPGAEQPVKPSATLRKTAPVPATLRAGKGWQLGAIPNWVVSPPTAPPGLAPAPAAGGRREQLVDFQSNYTLPQPTTFVRLRSVALDASALGDISQPQIRFNPAFQSVVIHHAAVLRNGVRSERLPDARIEPLRREQRLEQQVIDGQDTLLVVLNDVRIGDAVELAYSLQGENPIFEGRISGGMQLAWSTPVDLLHHRWVLAAGRPVATKSLATTVEPERFAQGGHDVLRVVRHQVPAVAVEQGTPSWFKVYPGISISEYRSWSEVDAWAQRLLALPASTPPELVAKAAELRATGLTDAALLSETLRFVQDEIRYFSVSLGESSHRPKPPQQTLAERLGDCKDKVVLFNTLLRELGFAARPALVSIQRNRGLENHLPAPDSFDHVITRVELHGKTWFLDPTVHGQGLQLEGRGQYPHGMALVVGAGDALTAVAAPPASLSRLEFEQVFDLATPGRPTGFETRMIAHGFLAERWRAALAANGLAPMAQALAGGHARMLPSLQPKGQAQVEDDRSANRLVLRQQFELPEFGQYRRGFLEIETLAVEMLDVLSGPSETQRRTPFMVDQPLLVEHRIQIATPLPMKFSQQSPLEVVDRQFRFSARLEPQGKGVSFSRRYERREDQVLPADLAAWREKIMQARNATSGRLRVPLVDTAALMPELQGLERRLRSARGFKDDQLQSILARNEIARLVDTRALERVAPGSLLAANIFASRAVANNLLGDFAAGRADAEQTLAIKAEDGDALDALAVALLGLGEAEQALATFARINPQSRSAEVAAWMGSIELFLGRAPAAERLLREALVSGSGEGREFTLIWLYLAAERAGGRGQMAVQEHLDGVDESKLTGALLRYLVGRIDRDALLRVASAKPEMERLNRSEAHFFIGQKLLTQGQREEAAKWFQRSIEQGAVPYREHTFSQLELKRLRR